MWGVIGGTGFEGMDGFDIEELLPIETPFGKASPGFKRVTIGGQPCLYIPRHGNHHQLTPSEINYCANIYALKAHGVTRILTLSAVGSLRQNIEPGHVVIPQQFVNRTLGQRRATFCGNGIVGHVGLAKPVWPQAISWLRNQSKTVDSSVHFDKTYVCVEGPFFSTQAEARMHCGLGFDIIGMTAYPEYALARESGMCYIPLCFVTDYDCWADDLEHVSVTQIVEMFGRNRHFSLQLLKEVLQATILEDTFARQGNLSNSLLSSKDHLGAEQAALLEVFAR